MSLIRLIKERDRLQNELLQEPTYIRLRKVLEAIALLEELDGGQTADRKVSQLRKMVDAQQPAPVEKRKTGQRDPKFVMSVAQQLAKAPGQTARDIAAAVMPERFKTDPTGAQARVYHTLVRLEKDGAVKRGKQPGTSPTAPLPWSVVTGGIATAEKKLEARQPKSKPVRNVARTQVTVIDPPEPLKGMPKNTPLNEALLATALHAPGDLTHIAGVLVGLGVVENDQPRRRIGIVLRNLLADKKLKKSNGGYAISAKGTQVLNELTASVPAS